MKVVVIGGGPAGLRAAMTLAERGLHPILLDEGSRPGGQGYRSPAPGIELDMTVIMGSQHAKYTRLHNQFSAQNHLINNHFNTSVWAIDGETLHVIHNGRMGTIEFDALIIASGATDRIFPTQGWTLPGVFSLGGAQIALKDQGAFIGRHVAFVGSSPLMALVAKQYHAMGASIAGVFDTTPFSSKIRALPQLMNSPNTTFRGLSYLTALGLAGIPLHFGVTPIRIEGRHGVEAIVFQADNGQEKRIYCDAVALGYGLKPETQLAELAGVSFSFDNLFRTWLPTIDDDGRAAANVYLAGDGAAIGGADAAEDSGTLAALALLSANGYAVSQTHMAKLRKRVNRLRNFQRGLAAAFMWPHQATNHISNETIVCRCENISAGEIRLALKSNLIPPEVNRAKAISRCGMGRCQGRMCGQTLQEIVAAESGAPLEAVGRLRSQAPIKPVALSAAKVP